MLLPNCAVLPLFFQTDFGAFWFPQKNDPYKCSADCDALVGGDVLIDPLAAGLISRSIMGVLHQLLEPLKLLLGKPAAGEEGGKELLRRTAE